MRLAVALITLATLSGCTVKYDLSGSDWRKTSTIIQQTTQDEIDCVRDAREAGWAPDLILGGLLDLARWEVTDLERLSSYRRCMVAKGYQPN
jgi:hypothetical protein